MITGSCPLPARSRLHVSIDDVELTLRDLINNGARYASVWESPLLAQLREWHQQYGAQFTLYGYTSFGDYSIEQIPGKWCDELQAAAEWLRWGWHWHSPEFSLDEANDPERARELAASHTRFCDAVTRFASATAIAPALRLHYFSGSQDLLTLINQRGGYSALLCADDPRRMSYDLTDSERGELYIKGTLTARDRRYVPTDRRVESHPWKALLRPGTLLRPLTPSSAVTALFTHEWAIYPRALRIDLSRLRHGQIGQCRALHRRNLDRALAVANRRGMEFTLFP